MFLSDLTLAFLEDTEQYRANYTLAGRLVDSTAVLQGGTCGRNSNNNFIDFLFGNNAAGGRDAMVAPVARAPGALRWGKGAGCSFVVGSAADWPAQYICAQDRVPGCTADNRMSAVCSIASSWSMSTDVSHGNIRLAGSSFFHTDCPSGVDCPLPAMFRYIEDENGQLCVRWWLSGWR